MQKQLRRVEWGAVDPETLRQAPFKHGPEPIPFATGDTDPATASFVRYRAQRDPVALERALLLCAPSLQRAARRNGCREVEDIVQECFVVAIRTAEKFDEGRRLMPWLLGILHNLARSRRWRRWQRIRGGTEPATVQEPTGPSEDPSVIVDRNEWLALLQTHLQELPQIYRPVLHGYLVDGKPPIEIAGMLRRSPSTVRTQLERGLRELRRRLPAPMLTGLTAILASRSATAGAGTTRHPAGGVRTMLGAAAILLAGLFVWLGTDPARRPDPSVVAAGAVAGPLTAVGATANAAEPMQRTLVASSAPNTVRVTLRWQDGGPAAGVAVILDPAFVRGQSGNRSRPGWRVVLTDARGEAVFANVPVGTVALRLHDQSTLREFEANGAEQTFAFSIQPTAFVTVNLVDSHGRPIEGGTVFASFEMGIRAPGYPAAQTDAQGEAIVVGLLPRFHVWGAARGYVTTAPHGPFGTSGAPKQEALTLQMEEPTQRCRGRIENERGEPIGGAIVAVWSTMWAKVLTPAYCFSDALGWFDVDGPVAGPWSVAAVAPGFASAEAQVESPEASAVLRLARGGIVEGRVLSVSAVRAARLRVITRNLKGDARNPLEAVGATVAPDGAYRLLGVAPGRYTVGLLEQGAREALAVQQVTVGEDTLRVDFPIVDQWNVHVVDALDQPIPGCLVRTVSPLPVAGWGHSQEVVSDAEGLVRLVVRDTVPQLVFVHLPRTVGTNEYPAVAYGELAPGTGVRIAVSDAARQPGSISGRLHPSCRGPDLREGLELNTPGGIRSISVAADGSFVAEDVPAGSYRLLLRLKDLPSTWVVNLAAVELQPGEQRDLGLLHDPGFGTVFLELDRRAAALPLTGTLRDGRGEIVEGTVLEPGKPCRRLLPSGRYALTYAASDAAPIERTFDVHANREIRVILDRIAGQPCQIQVHIDRGCPSRAPLVATVRAVATGRYSELLMPAHFQARMWLAHLDLQPGTYELSVRCASGATATGTLVVAAKPETQAFELRMQ